MSTTPTPPKTTTLGFLAKFLAYFPLVGPIVQGIEQIHGNAVSGADKKTLAMQSLGLAGAVASTVLPGEQTEIAATQQLASTVIDALVAAFNATGWGHSQAVSVTVAPITAPPSPSIVNPTIKTK